MIPVSLGALAASVYIDHRSLNATAATAMSKIERFAANLRMRGLANILIGVSFLAPMKAATNEAAAFEKQMRFVSTMVQDTSKWMPSFTKGIEDMSVQFGEGTATLSKGLYDILSAVFPAKDAMDILNVSVRAAKSGMTDTSVSVDAMTTVLNAYQLSAANAADVADWFFSVVVRGKTTYPELAQNIGMVATTAAMSGVSLTEMGAALSTMTRMGLKTDHAVTALNNILMEFLNPTQEAQQTARSLGFALSSATIKAHGLYWVFRQLQGLPADTISKLFPNIRGIRGVMPILQNMKGFVEDLSIVGNRAGQADLAFQKMVNDNPLYLFLDQATQGVIALGRALGNALTPVLLQVGQYLLPVLKYMGDFATAHKTMVGIVAGSIGALILAGVAMSILGLAIFFMQMPLSLISGGFRLLGVALGGLDTGIMLVGRFFTSAAFRAAALTPILNGVATAINAVRNTFEDAQIMIRATGAAGVGVFSAWTAAILAIIPAIFAVKASLKGGFGTHADEDWLGFGGAMDRWWGYDKQTGSKDFGMGNPALRQAYEKRKAGKQDAAAKAAQEAAARGAQQQAAEQAMKEAQVSYADWDQKVGELQARGITSRWNRERELINLKYDKELRDAGRNTDLIGRIQAAKNAEIQNLKASSLQEINDRIRSAEIDGIEDKWEREKALIQKKYEFEAEQAGRNTDLLQRLVKERAVDEQNLKLKMAREMGDQIQEQMDNLAGAVTDGITDDTTKAIVGLQLKYAKILKQVSGNPIAEGIAKEAFQQEVNNVYANQGKGQMGTKLATLAERGTAEAYTSIVGNGSLVKNTASMVEEQRKTNAKLEKLQGMGMIPPALDLGLGGK